MKRNATSERGVASIVLIILVLVLLIAAGYAIYNYTKSHNSSKNNGPTPTPSSSPIVTASPSAAANPTAGWKTATSSTAKFSFKYPANWSYRSNVNNGGAEAMYVTSPSDLQIEFLSYSTQSAYGQSALKANPDGTCSSCLATNKSLSFDVTGYGKLLLDSVTYGVGGGSTNELVLETASGSLDIVSPAVSGIDTNASALFQGSNQGLTASQFASNADVQTAEEVLKTLSY
ncbi:MAG: hypothetical protein WCF17_17520 [Terracidiphilus sp.]